MPPVGIELMASVQCLGGANKGKAGEGPKFRLTVFSVYIENADVQASQPRSQAGRTWKVDIVGSLRLWVGIAISLDICAFREATGLASWGIAASTRRHWPSGRR